LRNKKIVADLTLILALISLTPAFASAQTAAHLSVTISGQTLTAGFDNPVTIVISNDYYDSIYDVAVSFAPSSSAPLTIYGDSNWNFDSLRLGQSETIVLHIYAPTSAIGNVYQSDLTIMYKQLGDISYTSETHSVSFAIQGWINLVLYGIRLSPMSASPGGNVTVSGNLLNSGNVAAYNANITVESEAIDTENSNYLFIGEIDPNIPRPFSLLVAFRKGLSEGNYSLTVKASAVDSGRPASPYEQTQSVVVQIKKGSGGQTIRTGQQNGILEIILRILRSVFGAFFGSLSRILANAAPNYSYFKAITASILEARQAG